MTDRVVLTLTGEPVIRKGIPAAKGRARAVPRIVWQSGVPVAVVNLITPPDTRAAEAAIRAAFKRKYPDHRPWTGPVLLGFNAVFAIPGSFGYQLRARAQAGDLYVTKKPDKDNIEKLIVDALAGVAFVDDSQVIGGGVKIYGERPRLEFSLRRIAQVQTPAERAASRARQAELPLGRPPGPDGRKNAPAPVCARQIAEPGPGQRFNPYGGQPQPDLSAHSPRARALIEAALIREAKDRER